jgi:hypothetical protein
MFGYGWKSFLILLPQVIMSYKSADQCGSLSAGMADGEPSFFYLKVAHFPPEWVAQFGPE